MNKKLFYVLLLMFIFSFPKVLYAESNEEIFILQLKKFNEEEINKIKDTYKIKDIIKEFKMIIIESNNFEIENLKNNKNINFIEKNKIIEKKIEETQEKIVQNFLLKSNLKVESEWEMKKMDVEKLWKKGITGKGVKVAVIDTGVDFEHEDLKDVVKEVMVCEHDEPCEEFDNDKIYYLETCVLLYPNNEEICYPEHKEYFHGKYADDHGTHVAGIIAANKNNKGRTGVSYNSNIISYRVFDKKTAHIDKEGKRTNVITSSIMNQVYALRDIYVYNALDKNKEKISLVNMSLGGYVEGGFARKYAIQRLKEQGVIVLAASGNDNSNKDSYPSGYEEVVSVGAIDENGKRATFSNYGKIDLVAPGVNIYSSVPKDLDNDDNWIFGDGYTMMKGTSQATPLVTGMLALYKELFPHYNDDEIKRILYEPLIYVEGEKETIDKNGFKINEEYGRGILKANIDYKKLYHGLGDELYWKLIDSRGSITIDYIMSNDPQNSGFIGSDGWVKYKYEGKANGVTHYYLETGNGIKDDEYMKDKDFYIEFLDENNNSLGERELTKTGWNELDFDKPFTYFVLKNKYRNTFYFRQFELYDANKRYEKPKTKQVNQTLHLKDVYKVYKNIEDEKEEKSIIIPFTKEIKTYEAYGWLDNEKRFEWYKVSIPEKNLYDVWIKPALGDVKPIYREGVFDNNEHKMIYSNLYDKSTKINDNLANDTYQSAWFKKSYSDSPPQKIEHVFRNPVSINALYVYAYSYLTEGSTIEIEFLDKNKNSFGKYKITKEDSENEYVLLPNTYENVSYIKIEQVGNKDIKIVEIEFFDTNNKNEHSIIPKKSTIILKNETISFYDRPIEKDGEKVVSMKGKEFETINVAGWDYINEQYNWYQIEYNGIKKWIYYTDFIVKHPYFEGMLKNKNVEVKESMFARDVKNITDNDSTTYGYLYSGSTEYVQYTFPSMTSVKKAYIHLASIYNENYSQLTIKGLDEIGNNIFEHFVTEKDVLNGYFDLNENDVQVKSIRVQSRNGVSIREFDLLK